MPILMLVPAVAVAGRWVGERHDAMRILVMEDDAPTADHVANALREHGSTVNLAATGPHGLSLATGGRYDLMVIDRMLPGVDGLSNVRTVQAANVNTPVLFLTALGSVDDRVSGLEVGGEDYLAKPFAFSGLLARINARDRRPSGEAAPVVLCVADLEMDPLRRTVVRQGQVVRLQRREFQLLEYLMRHASQVVTRTMLLEHVWDFHFDPQTNLVETHVGRLRAKVDKPFDKPLIETVRGAGYRLRAPTTRPTA